MDLTRKTATLATAAAATLFLSACGQSAPEPQNEVTGAAMPDTSQPGPNPPDAGATGVVPPSGDVPMQQEKAPAQNSGGLPPVDLPDVQAR